MNYSEIARRTGLSVSHVSRVMRKERKPSLGTMFKMAQVMGLSANQMMRKLGVGRRGWGKK